MLSENWDTVTLILAIVINQFNISCVRQFGPYPMLALEY
jgi:hypothetical protein